MILIVLYGTYFYSLVKINHSRLYILRKYVPCGTLFSIDIFINYYLTIKNHIKLLILNFRELKIYSNINVPRGTSLNLVDN